MKYIKKIFESKESDIIQTLKEILIEVEDLGHRYYIQTLYWSDGAYPEIIKFGIKAKNIVFVSDIIEILIRVKDFLEMEGYLPDDKTNLCIKHQLEILRKYHKPKVLINEYSFSFKK